MRKWRHIYVELYQLNIYFIKCSSDYYQRKVAVEFDCKPPSMSCDVTGRFAVFQKKNIDVGVVWVKDWKWLAHELFHATHWIAQDRGLYLTDESEEAYAYLISYLDRKIRKAG